MSEETAKPTDARPKKPKWISERVRDDLQAAVDRGEFSNLPGQGRPLDLTRDDNPFVPDDLKLSYRILSNAGIGVPWIEDRKEIDRRKARLERDARLHEARLASLAGISAACPPSSDPAAPKSCSASTRPSSSASSARRAR